MHNALKLALCALLLCATAKGEETAPAPAEPSPECLNLGGAVQSACGDDVKTATTFFNGTTSPPENKVQAFIRNASISDSCCAASKELNAARCNYEAPVQELAAALIGADVATYDRFASAVAQICGFVKIC